MNIKDSAELQSAMERSPDELILFTAALLESIKSSGKTIRDCYADNIDYLNENKSDHKLYFIDEILNELEPIIDYNDTL